MKKWEAIQKMDREELARLLWRVGNSRCSVCAYDSKCDHEYYCLDGIMKWLNNRWAE